MQEPLPSYREYGPHLVRERTAEFQREHGGMRNPLDQIAQRRDDEDAQDEEIEHMNLNRSIRIAKTALSLAIASTNAAAAPADPPYPKPGENCKPAEYRAFDFAHGHFRMVAGDGQLAGHLRMVPMLAGCSTRGHWRGAIAGRGEVTTWYDRFQQRWHQLYVDDDGHPLMMSAGVQDGALVFTGVNTFFDGRSGLHRMSWSPLPGGGVRQHWELSMDNGKTWESLIDARGRRLADRQRPVRAPRAP